MRRLILAGFVSLAAFGAVQFTLPKADAAPPRCDLVRCAECPAGTVLKPTGNNCCRCKAVKI